MTPVTAAACPPNENTSGNFASARSQTRAVLSTEPDSSRRLSAANTSEVIASKCPGSENFNSPVARARIRIVGRPSSVPETASNLPSGLTAATLAGVPLGLSGGGEGVSSSFASAAVATGLVTASSAADLSPGRVASARGNAASRFQTVTSPSAIPAVISFPSARSATAVTCPSVPRSPVLSASTDGSAATAGTAASTAAVVAATVVASMAGPSITGSPDSMCQIRTTPSAPALASRPPAALNDKAETAP